MKPINERHLYLKNIHSSIIDKTTVKKPNKKTIKEVEQIMIHKHLQKKEIVKELYNESFY